MKQTDFLKSSLTHTKIVGTINQRQSFSRMLKKFRSGTLKPLPGKREMTRKFVQVEERLIHYINLRTEKYKRDKCGLSWMLLKEKTMKWGNELGLEAFQASNGWITNTLRRYGITRVTLHDEANDLTDEDVEKVMTPWRKELKDLIEEKVWNHHVCTMLTRLGFSTKSFLTAFTSKNVERKMFLGSNEWRTKLVSPSWSLPSLMDQDSLLL